MEEEDDDDDVSLAAIDLHLEHQLSERERSRNASILES